MTTGSCSGWVEPFFAKYLSLIVTETSPELEGEVERETRSVVRVAAAALRSFRQKRLRVTVTLKNAVNVHSEIPWTLGFLAKVPEPDEAH